jgi:ferredoxin-NADP reductase
MLLTFQKSFPREGDARSFIFDVTGPANWQPGQYTHFVLPHDNADDRGDDRWFTISSAPSEGYVMVTTRINHIRSSTFKEQLQKLEPGKQIEADAPEGDFVVDDPARELIFVAGGIGVTPYRSILKEADANGQQLKVHLLYANRDENIVFQKELEEFAARNPKLKIDYVVGPGKLDADTLKTAIDAANNPVVYLSGPEPMVEDLELIVQRLGVAAENIKTDFFPGYEAV